MALLSTAGAEAASEPCPDSGGDSAHWEEGRGSGEGERLRAKSVQSFALEKPSVQGGRHHRQDPRLEVQLLGDEGRPSENRDRHEGPRDELVRPREKGQTR